MWNSLGNLLDTVEIPQMIPVRQRFSCEVLENWQEALKRALISAGANEVVRPGMRIAITAGSRGIDHIADYLRFIGEFLRAQGANPFVVPAMGSHGGATVSGQILVLEGLGITEESVEMPIHASMDTVLMGMTPEGLPAYTDRIASEADGIILVNRIKAHTQFRGPYESGLLKMLTIGLGKQRGAECCHRLGLKNMSKNVEDISQFLLGRLPILFGVGLLENAYDRTMAIEGIPAQEIMAREPGLLERAKANMPHICVPNLDVLVVDRIGKNYSGSGMDPNVTGRFYSKEIPAVPAAQRIAVLGLSEETHGNGCGLGVADTTTRRVVDHLDRESMYVNGLTSRVAESGRIPLYFDNDREAIQAAIKLTGKLCASQLRMARIPNTMQLERIQISEVLAQEAQDLGLEIVGKAEPLAFDTEGNLL